MKKLIVIILMLVTGINGYACGNEFGYTLDGKRVYTQYFFLSERMLTFDTLEINKKLDKLNNEVANGKADYKTWSNIALNLMKLGKADSSLKILIPLSKTNPTNYTIIANLGTAYELNGKLDSALKYIKKGYELNKQSHFGSEWIHIKILEAKIKEKQSPGWLQTNPIISVNEMLQHRDTSRLRRFDDAINNHLFYQIRTRVPFTPAPNKVIANLLKYTGDYNTEYGTYENAILCYAYALQFESHYYLKSEIKRSISKLNQKRDAVLKDMEFAPIFVHQLKYAKLNPDLFLMGLDSVASELDSLHLHYITMEDSITALHNQLDSIDSISKIEKQPAEIEVSNDSFFNIKNLAIGLVLGAGLVFGVLKLKK